MTDDCDDVDDCVTLGPKEPSKNPLEGGENKKLRITNSTGHDITITAEDGVFKNMEHKRINIKDKKSKKVTLGKNSGDYWYWVPQETDETDETEDALGVRTGRIQI